MAITDINISEQLETSAPSIKYEGNEGPKSPEEQRMVQLKQEYMQYVFEQKDLQQPVMSFEEWYQAVYQASKMGVDASQQLQPQPQMRQPVAYGGIMDLGGRRRYGWGSKIKKKIRNLIPNEAAKVAQVAAPFVAPFNPLAAGLMSGIGGFDRTGSIGKGLKSGLLTYGGGQLARGIGGAQMQKGFNPMGGMENMKYGFSKPYQPGQDIFSKTKERFFPGKEVIDTSVTETLPPQLGGPSTKKMAEAFQEGPSGIMSFIDKNSKAILLGSMGIAAATAKPQDMQEAARAARGTGLDIDGIRAEVQAALAGGEAAWAELQKKYPYVGEFPTKKAAEGGRIGLYAGGQSTPSDYTMEDARKTSMQDKMGGITDVMKQADLYRQGDVGQFYAAQGGRIGYRHGENYKSNQGSNEMEFNRDALLKYLKERGASDEEIYEIIVQGRDISDQYKFEKFNQERDLAGERRAEPFYPDRFEGQRRAEPFYPDRFEGRLEPMAHGGRIGAQEGGLMDLGGMEKDYRNDGGFVPIGGKEKADDVPARLSKNEFVFTADAVRGAGDGDIDKGAEIMENIMKNLEQGGQISEETQGLAGAQEMFDVSERLSEVV